MSVIRRAMMNRRERDIYFTPSAQAYTDIVVGDAYNDMTFDGKVEVINTFSQSRNTYYNVFTDYTDETTHHCWRFLPYRLHLAYINTGNKPSMTEYYDNENNPAYNFVAGSEIEFHIALHDVVINGIRQTAKRNSTDAAIQTSPIFITQYYRYYNLKAWKGDTIVADYVARNLNGQIVFYNKVTGHYITS